MRRPTLSIGSNWVLLTFGLFLISSTVEVNKWEEHKREEEAIFHGHIDHVDWHFRHAYFGVEYEGDHGSEND